MSDFTDALARIDRHAPATDVVDALMDAYRAKFPDATLDEAEAFAEAKIAGGFLL